MYFLVRYIEYPKFNSQSDPVSKCPSSDQISLTTSEKGRERVLSLSKSSRRNVRNSVSYDGSVESYDQVVTVVDDNKEVLVNPDCFLGSIIDYIREVAAIPKTKNFKMCTIDGDVTEFSNVLSTSGLEYFQPKQTYCIFFQENTAASIENRTPLLSKCSDLYSILSKKFKQTSSEIQIETKEIINKPITKSKERIRGRRSSRKETKSGFLPPIKQNNQ